MCAIYLAQWCAKFGLDRDRKIIKKRRGECAIQDGTAVCHVRWHSVPLKTLVNQRSQFFASRSNKETFSTLRECTSTGDFQSRLENPHLLAGQQTPEAAFGVSVPFAYASLAALRAPVLGTGFTSSSIPTGTGLRSPSGSARRWVSFYRLLKPYGIGIRFPTGYSGPT